MKPLDKLTPAETRRWSGEAWWMCNDCGARLGSFDGNIDRGVKCPYEQRYEGNRKRCEPPGEF